MDMILNNHSHIFYIQYCVYIYIFVFQKVYFSQKSVRVPPLSHFALAVLFQGVSNDAEGAPALLEGKLVFTLCSMEGFK